MTQKVGHPGVLVTKGHEMSEQTAYILDLHVFRGEAGILCYVSIDNRQFIYYCDLVHINNSLQLYTMYMCRKQCRGDMYKAFRYICWVWLYRYDFPPPLLRVTTICY